MDWRDRIVQRMDECGIKTRFDLSTRANISAGSLNMALNGTHELKLNTMEKLANALDTTTRWLLYGDDIVEARQVPYLKTSSDIQRFIVTKEIPKFCDYIQIVHDLHISNRAFAMKNREDDMSPVIENGDVLIIDVMEEQEYQHNKPLYALVVDGFNNNKNVMSSMDLVSNPGIRLFIRKLVRSSGEFYFQTEDSRYPPIPLAFPVEDVGKFTFMVGVVIQKIVTYVYDIDKKQP